MNQEWHHFFYLLIPIFVLIWWLLKNKSIQVLKNVTIMAVLSGLLGWAVYEHQTKTQSAEANANVQTGIQKGKKRLILLLRQSMEKLSFLITKEKRLF